MAENTNTEREATGPAEVWLRSRYGAYRGHFAWRELEEAFNAGRASLSLPAAGQEPVADRAFLERTLSAMEGVIDVADRQTVEFDALRSCVIDLTLILFKAAPQPALLVERPCHVFTVRKNGALTEWEATTMALALPDGEHALYTAPQPAVAAGWLPIETAPKDGTLILVREERCSGLAVLYSGGWKYENGNICYLEPTHWMPLPPAPSTEGDGNG